MALSIVFVLLGILSLQIVGFIIAYLLRTDKITDAFYGGSFILLALVLFIISFQMPSHILLLSMVIAWGGRLSGYLFMRVLVTGRDARFDQIRNHPARFAGFWGIQALTIFFVSFPLIYGFLVSLGSQITATHVVGFLVWMCGLVVETVADYQKFQFRNDPTNSGTWIQSGIWKYSRHPNYFGEMLVWIGIFVASGPWQSLWWMLFSFVGVATIVFLLRFVSGVPILERKNEERYGSTLQYQEYKRNTNLLLPLPKWKWS